MFYSVIGLVVAVNIAIVVIGWPYAYELKVVLLD